MENVAGKIKAIAEKVSEIFYRNEKQQFERRNEVKDWVVRLYRYNHDQDKEQNHSNISPNETTNGNRDPECDDHGLCIHLPLEHAQFYIHSEPTSLSFNAGPETLVVTVGKQLEVRNEVALALLLMFWMPKISLLILELCRDLNVFQGK